MHSYILKYFNNNFFKSFFTLFFVIIFSIFSCVNMYNIHNYSSCRPKDLLTHLFPRDCMTQIFLRTLNTSRYIYYSHTLYSSTSLLFFFFFSSLQTLEVITQSPHAYSPVSTPSSMRF